jgi:predicted membrane protein
MKRNQALRSFMYMGLGLAMLFYAIPQLPGLSPSAAGVFSVVWLLFGILVIGANLYYLIGVDKERKRRAQFQKEWEREVGRMAARLQYERRRRRMLSR